MGLSRKDLDEQYDHGYSSARHAFQEQMREQIGAASEILVKRLEEKLKQAEDAISDMTDKIDRLESKLHELEPWERI